ncbi:MAG: 4-hydroxythreonine-4-phosphate dehydrogenase PdxA [Planctomycetes bacterium]|nr:4-hydroxythreonine-4-phosphate dehydrogenase PdxA [Planctomycetota bacterium]
MQPRIAVPQGDLGGIGPEVALTVLARPELRSRCRPLLLGHRASLEQIAEECGIVVELQAVPDAEAGFAAAAGDAIPVLELECPPPHDEPGAPAASFGRAAIEAVLRSGSMCLEGRADAVVTPPIHKESMRLAGFAFEGQTQIFGELSNSRRYGMLACNGNLRVLLATRHMPLREALGRLEINLIAKQIRIAFEAAHNDLGIANPRVVLAGLNPHAGEYGAFGKEELKILEPAIEMAEREYGFRAAGPAVPDVVFSEGAEGKWDIVIALYHDQAFIPLKLLGRDRAHTLFVGGKILRVSPMHGSAYDIARTGQAEAEPFAFAFDRMLEYVARRSETKQGASQS